MILGGNLNEAATGVFTAEDGQKQSVFELYYKPVILDIQKDKDVLVPFGWLYGAMWYNDANTISTEKIKALAEKAYTCKENKCTLVTLNTFITNIKPILVNKTVTEEMLKQNIELFADAEELYYGTAPTKISEYKNLEMAYPLNPELYRVTSRYGLYDPWNTGEWKLHEAIDLAPNDHKEGATLFAMVDATVSGKGNSKGYGYYITIQSKEYPEFSILYAHMRYPTHLNIGDSINKGQGIGYLGNTGNSTGPHVHIEFMENMKKFNPELGFKF